MSWNVHIRNLCKKVSSSIGALKRIRRFVSPSTMQLIYSCLVQPYFDYCCVIQGSCGGTLADKLQKLQNRATRVLTSSSYDTNADYLFENLGWKNLASQRKIAKAIVYKSLNGPAPDFLTEMFVDRSSVTNYTLRDTGGKLPQPRTNYLKIVVRYPATPFHPSYDKLALYVSSNQTAATSYDNFQIFSFILLIAQHSWKTGTIHNI